MKDSIVRKGFVLGIIVLFIGVGFVPSIIGSQENPFIAPNQDRCSEINKQYKGEIYPTNQGERWALLIDIADIFSTDLMSMKTVLCRNGWQEDHIKMVVGDSIKAKDIIDSLSWLASQSSSDDTVLIYLCAHGSYYRFYLQDETSMYYWRLNRAINKIKAQGMTVVIHCCHGGSAIPFLKNKNRIIITSCKWNKLATSYHNRFNIALQGFSDLEGNNDNFASAEELFKYTLEDERGIDTPQIQDGYPGELLLTSVNLTFIDKENIDVYHNHPYDLDWSVHNEQSIAQSFKPLGDKITKIKLLLRSIYTNNSLVVSIRESLYGPDLTSKIIPADTFSDCEGWVNRFFEIDLPDIVVNPNEMYYIVCTCDSEKSYRLYADSIKRDDYHNGQFFERHGGGSWNPVTNLDLIFIIYGENINNVMPNKPDKPSGKTNIKPEIDYTYTTSVTDPNGDQVYYMWDWGDGNKSDWLGPFDSGKTIYADNSWIEKGHYEIKVKAKDVHGMRGDWSNPLPVIMSKNKPQAFNFNLIDQLFERFSLLQKILDVLRLNIK
jgi:hypothetical protein